MDPRCISMIECYDPKGAKLVFSLVEIGLRFQGDLIVTSTSIYSMSTHVKIKMSSYYAWA